MGIYIVVVVVICAIIFVAGIAARISQGIKSRPENPELKYFDVSKDLVAYVNRNGGFRCYRK